jgi:hypothetical protein
MTNRIAKDLKIDTTHSLAICEEIGDRLRQILGPKTIGPLPPHLQNLLEQLAKLDHEATPSLVPTLGDLLSATEDCLIKKGAPDQQPVKRKSGPSHNSRKYALAYSSNS